MNTSMPWIKLYTEILDDVKLSRLTDAQKWRFVQLLLLAGECDAEGALVTGDSPMTPEDVSWRLRIDTQTIVTDLEKLTALGLLHIEDGAIIISKFADRQGPTQEEKREQWRNRQKAHRERIKTTPVTGESRVSNAPRVEEDKEKEEEKELILTILSEWEKLFPNKPQPKPATYKSKIEARWKNPHFRENWQLALQRASESPSLQKDSWFNFGFFIRNDENYQKMLDRWMQWKDDQAKNGNSHKPTGKVNNAIEYLKQQLEADDGNQ